MKKVVIKEPKISKKLADYLEEKKYQYEIIKHRTTYTAWDTAQTEKVKPQEVVKGLIMRADKDWILAILPSNRNLDKKSLLKIINSKIDKKTEKICKKIDFADEKWMKKNIRIGKLGAIPPFRDLVKKNIFLDKMILKNKKIYLSSGEYDSSLRVSVSQYVKKEEPIMGNFSIKKG